MIIKTRTTDREALIAFLEETTGKKAEYFGAPTFKYRIGGYTVLRNADIEAEIAPEELMASLAAPGFLPDEEEIPGIKVPFHTSDAKSRINLICMLAMREKLLNKAVGKDNAFIVRRGFLKKLRKDNPATLDTLRTEMEHLDAGRNLRGIRILDECVIFTGFPETETELERKAFTDLAACMVQTAERKRWIKMDAEDVVNEKYTFRIFLMQIGMMGEDFDTTRALLLERLDGDIAFRLPEQKELFNARRREELRRRREEEHIGDFIAL